MTDPKALDQFDIAGRSALVTGAASGIGLAYAECMAETYQIKPLALLLASDAGSYMTGSHVMIDGGMQLGPVKPLDN